jgi:uncharacterized membrane protein YoaK (UPF0700 family)
MSSEIAERRWRLAVRLAGAAFIWSLGLVLAALLVPVYNGHTVSSASGLTVSTVTLVVENGAWVLLPVAVPAIACVVVGVALRTKRGRGGRRSATVAWTAIGLLTAFSLLAILSIGIYVAPVALLLATAAAITPEPAQVRRAQPVVPSFERL